LDFDLWEFGSETVCPRQTGTGMSARFVRDSRLETRKESE
jgi:hypothetical protein